MQVFTFRRVYAMKKATIIFTMPFSVIGLLWMSVCLTLPSGGCCSAS